jgi:hypothetical protein
LSTSIVILVGMMLRYTDVIFGGATVRPVNSILLGPLSGSSIGPKYSLDSFG